MSRQKAIAEHRVADEWRDCILVCSCGWRTAERTKTEARREWLAHVQKHAEADSSNTITV